MGRIHLNISHGLLPSWLCKQKDVGQGKKKGEVRKKCEETSPIALARLLSLRRANARAKACRSESSGDHNYEQCVGQHRFSQSIDALYVLSGVKEDGLGWLGSKVDGSGKLGTCKSMEGDLWDAEVTPNVSGRRDVQSIARCCIELEDRLGVRRRAEESEVPIECDGRKGAYRRTSLSACLPSGISGSLKDSMALVKYSYNPFKDFRDSMMQMIEINNIMDTPSDLEELLYCYFSLNSPEHYDCIKDAFRDICRELESKL